MSKAEILVAACASVLINGTCLAHHTNAYFDRSKVIVVTGKVMEYHLVNPHSWIYLDSMSADGKVLKWAFETNADVSQLVRQRWTADIIKPGETVTATVNPLKDGSNGGLLISVKLANGMVLSGK